ncbi:MAG: low molecular weight protein-tyrosine-phosphatase [Candidatus Melainabacteria bacterium]
MVAVLFVCMGNICRSPTADGVFAHLVEAAGWSDRIRVDSAGTHAYHTGEPPDPRSCQTARARGVPLDHLRARQFTQNDFETFDYILAMDKTNLAILKNAADPSHHPKIRLFLAFAPDRSEEEVPDPYYGGARGFDHVYDLIEDASHGLLAEIMTTHG